MPSQGKGNRLDASETMMMMRLTLPYIVFFLMFICAKNVANAAGDHWCYKDSHCDAKTWAGECQTGKQQSPIDFNEKNTKLFANSIRLRFNKPYLDVHDRFMIKNNGHTIQVQLGNSLTSDLVFDGDFLKGSYRFSQLHFHWGSHEDTGSEHTVHGNGYVAELHLVHYSNDYKSLTDAVASKNRRGLAVLGIFFEISSQENYALQPIIDAIQKVDEPSGKLVEVKVPLNVSALLPNDLSLWRYYGSLTTPSCNEVVHWTVFRKAVPMSRKQWQQFLSTKDPDDLSLEDNNRPTQPTINRKATFFDHVVRERMPGEGELDKNPPADDTFFEKAQKDINSKGASSGDEKPSSSPSGNETEGENNGANPSGIGGIFNSALTGFLFISLLLQIILTSILKCT